MDNKNLHQFTNKLINETSPYLLQHAHNPVDWYPWGEEALNKAKSENKMLLISIGYAACHWCHVMEHESFEDEQIAAIMNEHFVCIKVDREERPDIDHQYMDAVQLMTGTGGWPLNCFALPDGRPVYGGTYFRKDQWVSLLNQLAEMYENDRPRILEYADQMTAGLKDYNLVHVNAGDIDFNEKEIKEVVENWKDYFDLQWGGKKGAPKFPMPNNFMFLFDYYYFTQDELVKDYIELSLDKMAKGGIYDQIGGGFARYSTDANWKVPHFEKMLYDNAQLVSVYSKAYNLYKKPEYKSVVFETLAFLKRELSAQNKGFFSSIDADSEGEEGLFYVWKKNQIEQLLGGNAPLLIAFFNIKENGNWEGGKNIFFQEKSVLELANDFGSSPKEVENNLKTSKKILFDSRQKRKRPMTDDKVLTSWNALAISALTDAYRAFGEKQFLKDALSNANFIKETRVTQDGKVFRMTKKDGTMLSGFLDDYSFLAQSYIDLYQATFDEQWLLIAEKITQFAIAEFYNDSTGMFYYSSNSDKSVITPKTEVSDNVIPSSNSSIALVMNQLSVYFDDEDLSSKSRKMMNNIYPQTKKNGAYYSNWGILLSNMIYSPPEVVFSGENASKLREVFDQNFQVSTVAGSNGLSDMPLLENRFVEGKTYIYVCKNKTCKLPVQTVKEALKEM